MYGGLLLLTRITSDEDICADILGSTEMRVATIVASREPSKYQRSLKIVISFHMIDLSESTHLEVNQNEPCSDFRSVWTGSWTWFGNKRCPFARGQNYSDDPRRVLIGFLKLLPFVHFSREIHLRYAESIPMASENVDMRDMRNVMNERRSGDLALDQSRTAAVPHS